MADTPGKDSQPDPKAVGPTGPVKPPVLEGTARPAKAEDKPAPKTEAPKPASKPDLGKAASMPTPKPVVKRDREENGGSPWIAGLLGGIVGLGAAYGLAYAGLWPTTPQAPAPADPRVAQFATAIPELQTVTNTVQDELSTLNGRVSGLETSLAELPAPAAAPAPSEDYSEAIADLAARVEQLAGAAQPAATDTGALDALRTELAALSETVEQAQADVAATQGDIAALEASAATQTATGTGAARLPLIFSGLESAFATGRPFETELAALETAQPDATVPRALSDNAASGLPRPDDVARRLDAALPDMLAGRPVSADAGWQDATADWFRGVIAMRPAGDVDGDSPDAMIARLEAAVARRDFVAAEAEFTALPQTMQAAAGTLGDDIAALAAAATLMTELRSTALGAEGGA
ncbi:hypothetical protein [Devosia rhizoryzae]|uniref:Inner membrane protein n=1 Tax=Devosia rhizoryzae TaxID=2774137 RepID=A0ABX7C4J9_9HYPH|nr:hypothetical protein [Devosia rhizoryzae]QQR39169.1 hypothetical protein JI748_15795 [Devosia rhizoryzae]